MRHSHAHPETVTRKPRRKKRSIAGRHRSLWIEPLERRTLLAIFTVNSTLLTKDSFADDGICDTANDPTADPPIPPSGICTLRAALEQASGTGGDDEIRFAIPGGGIPVIDPPGSTVGSLDSGSVEIDGTTQAGGKVELRGGIFLGGSGGHTVKGLVFSAGSLRLFGSGNTVIGNYFGTNADGTALGVGAASLVIEGDNNRVGGIIASERNLIVGKLSIAGSNNHIQGNYIGTDITGETALRGESVQVIVSKGLDNEIGGDSADKGNLIVGHNKTGAIRIEPSDADIPRQTIIRNNFIGTNKDGTVALGSIGGGVVLINTTDNAIFDNVIAASREADGFTISANGILIGDQTHRTHVQGNKIGTDVTGTVTDPDGVPNSGDEFGHHNSAVLIAAFGLGATGNVIGGTMPSEANVIAGSEFGVRIFAGAEGNTVLGNFIGTNATGTAALPNQVGVYIENAPRNLIGGLARNVISGNIAEGVRIAGILATDNMVANNFIGVNAAGTAALPNDVGVVINGGPANCIGGVIPADFMASPICAASPSGGASLMGNVISGNTRYGVDVFNDPADGNLIQGNRIGTNVMGTAAIGNGWDGVAIEVGADENVIGGTSAGRGNLISGNIGDGVVIIGAVNDRSMDNVIAGNFIGTDGTGELELPNQARGIHLDGNVFHTVIGGETLASRNVISGNRLDGIIIAFNTTTANVIQNNYIGTDKDGVTAIANKRHGIFVLNSPGNTIGRLNETDQLGNVISGNTMSGVRIEGADATDNELMANAIGTNALRTERLGNGMHGVHIVDAGENLIGGSFIGNPSSTGFLGNVISGNQLTGIRIEGATADKNYIGANLIGMDGTGTQSLYNVSHGIHVSDASETRIGASHVAEYELSGNTISNNLNGIKIEGASATETLIGGNRIGTDWQGLPGEFVGILGNTVNGVWIVGASETYIGGLFLKDGQATQVPENIIAWNNVGVRVEGDTALFNKIQRNQIFSNMGLGIDLGGDGITPNDDDSAPTGPNRRQNFPVILKYQDFNQTLKVRFVSRPLESFTFDLYMNPSDDSSGAGEGQIWLREYDVMTDQDGTVELELPATIDKDFPWLVLTATDGAGNTSEFSSPLRQADLAVDAISLFPIDVLKNAQGYNLPVDVTVRNIGTAPANNARIVVTGNGQDIGITQDITLQPGESQVLSGTWLLNSLLQAEPRGFAVLDLVVRADPNNLIDELPNGVNNRSAAMTIDARPRITAVKKEYAEGVFLQNVPLENTIDVFVDWNGDLDSVVFTASDLPEFNFEVNGVPILSDGGVVSATSAAPTHFTIGMHDDLQIGANLLMIEARNRLQNFYSDPMFVRYDQVATVPFIDAPLWTVVGNGGPYEKTAQYKSKIFLPQLATGGFVNVPVDRVGVAGGAFGPEIRQVAVTVVVRSDRTNSIDGEFKMVGDLTDKDLGGIDSSITAAAHGTFEFTPGLNVLDFSGKLQGSVAVKSPKVPLPPAPWVRAQATVGLGVDATLAWKQNAAGEFELAPNVILGLEPYAEFALSVSYRGVGVEVAGGAKIRGEFSLAQNPCLVLGGNVQLYVKLKFSAWIFEASKTVPVASVAIPACGGAAAAAEGELDALGIIPSETNWVAMPRYVRANTGEEGEPPSSSLPSVAFPNAKPSLARHSDGTMTLVYVNEDPAKADGQQLEIFATHFDGSTWSTPAQITNDTLLDDAPSVTYDDDGNAIAVWSQIKQTIANPMGVDPQTLLGDLEIMSSVRDAVTGLWSTPTALTNDSSMDNLPQVARGLDGQIMAVWTHDAGNDSPLAPDDATRSLGADFHYALWNGLTWSAPAVAIAGVASSSPGQLALGTGEGLLVWAEDDDANVTTDTDTSIRAIRWDGAAWSAPVSLGGLADGLADLTPQVAFARPGQATIGWVRAGVPIPGDDSDFYDELVAVDYDSGVFSSPATLNPVDDITKLHLLYDNDGNELFVWTGLSDAGPDILVAQRDATTGVLGEPVPLTSTPDLEWSLQPFINGAGHLEVIHLVRELGSEIVDLGGSSPSPSADGEPGDMLVIPTFLGSSLASVSGSLQADLVIESVTPPPDLEPGAVVEVTVVVFNRGEAPAPSFLIELLDDSLPVGSAQTVPSLLGGSRAILVFPWTVPTGALAPHTLLARADVNDEVLEELEDNNEQLVPVLEPDLLVENVYASRDGDELTVGARVYNRGGSTITAPFAVELRLDDATTGPLIGTTSIEQPLAFGEWVDVSFTITDPLETLEGVRTGFFRADPADAIVESSDTNNTTDVRLNPFTSWRNPRDPLDVNFDTFISPIDALLIINEINENGSALLPVPAVPPAFLDSSGDRFVSPIDALLVINHLNGLVDAEGEADAESIALDRIATQEVTTSPTPVELSRDSPVFPVMVFPDARHKRLLRLSVASGSVSPRTIVSTWDRVTIQESELPWLSADERRDREPRDSKQLGDELLTLLAGEHLATWRSRST